MRRKFEKDMAKQQRANRSQSRKYEQAKMSNQQRFDNEINTIKQQLMAGLKNSVKKIQQLKKQLQETKQKESDLQTAFDRLKAKHKNNNSSK